MFKETEPFLHPIVYDWGRKVLFYTTLVLPTISRRAYGKNILETEGKQSLLKTEGEDSLLQTKIQ